MLTFRGLCGKDQATLEEIGARPTVALALDQLEADDLTFGLAAAPRLGQGSADRCAVAVQA